MLSLLGWLLVGAGFAALAHAAFTFGILYYELANGPQSQRRDTPHLRAVADGDRRRGRGLLRLLRLARTVALEALANFLSWLIFPLRLVPDGAWHQLRFSGEGRTILMVHGYGHSPAHQLYFGWRLGRRTGRPVAFVRLRPAFGSIEAQAEALARRIATLTGDRPEQRVDLVCHSMGGIVARCFMQFLGGHTRVGRLVTVGTPHHGTRLAVYGRGRCARQLVPGGRFLERLESESSELSTRVMTSIWSTHDNVVVPTASAHVGDGACLRELADIGHFSMVFSPRTLEHAVAALGGERPRDDAGGAGITAAVGV